MSAIRRLDADLDMMDNTIMNAKVDGYYSKDEVNNLLGGLNRFELKIVDTLPEVGEAGYIYLVPATSPKTKNVRDEYIWIDSDWEMIGSTTFKLNVTQTADGIAINDDVLQKATETQDGLMTKEMVKEFRGKQDKLTAGPNISIENGVISAIGGGTGGGHASFMGYFGGNGRTEYTVTHGLGTYNIIFQMRTAPPVRFVQATVYADDENSIRVVFSEPMNDVVHISILACDASSTPSAPSGVVIKTIEQGSSVWTYINDTGKPMYVQLFESDGNEIRGDVTQESTEAFSPVVASLTASNTGMMLVKPADIVVTFTQETNVVIDVTEHGCTADDMFLVQVYIDGTGQSMPDIIQDAGTGIVSVGLGDEAKTGTIVLVKASQKHRIEGETNVVYTHNLGRTVGVQLYLDGTGQAMADVVCVDLNTVEVTSNIALTGTLLVL